jgi:hypothetical protein
VPFGLFRMVDGLGLSGAQAPTRHGSLKRRVVRLHDAAGAFFEG